MDKLEREIVGTSAVTPTTRRRRTPSRRWQGFPSPRYSAPTMAPTRLPRSSGSFAPPPSRAKGARCCSSSTIAKSPPPGANWPRTWWPTSISTARWRTAEREKGVRHLSIASAARSPIGASRTAISPRRPTASVSTASCAGCACTSLPSFNSPVWFNVGLYHQYGIKGAMCNWHWDAKTREAIQPENPYEYPQASACFIQSVQDNMEDIMELARSEAMLFKFGSGTGTDLSTLRSHREKLSGGGKPLGAAVVHAGVRPDRGGGQERRQDPPGRQDAVDQGLASRRDGVHRVQEPRGEEGPHAGRAGLRPAGGLRHGALPERQSFRPA